LNAWWAGITEPRSNPALRIDASPAEQPSNKPTPPPYIGASASAVAEVAESLRSGARTFSQNRIRAIRIWKRRSQKALVENFPTQKKSGTTFSQLSATLAVGLGPADWRRAFRLMYLALGTRSLLAGGTGHRTSTAGAIERRTARSWLTRGRSPTSIADVIATTTVVRRPRRPRTIGEEDKRKHASEQKFHALRRGLKVSAALAFRHRQLPQLLIRSARVRRISTNCALVMRRRFPLGLSVAPQPETRAVGGSFIRTRY
jgi:hypothetical protein